MKLHYNIKYLLFFFIVQVFIACNEENNSEVPSNIVSEETFINLLKDIHIAESAVEKMRLENVESIIKHKKTFFENVIHNYGLTEKDFNDNYDFYSKDASYFSEIYEKVLESLSIEQALTEEKNNELKN